MLDIVLSPAAQKWISVVLIWVGFGTIAGLLATVFIPLRRAVGPFSMVVIGIVGSTVGLLGLSWLYPNHTLNPISPAGFLAAAIGSLVVLVVHRVGGVFAMREEAVPSDEDDE
jgi:uncharacterized membrane protein YeaQ/YmgE (transglycosylase-associated protein family)